MNNVLAQTQTQTLASDRITCKKIDLNYRRNKEQDHTAKLDAAAKAFVYSECKNEYWNPEEFSLLWGTPLWDQATESQRVLLNQLYWVGYYSQIISAEIATIYFNQTSAAGLYGLEDFRSVCDMLDLESSQERAHIAAFKKISEDLEAEVFGQRIFTYPMRHWATETMILNDAGFLKRWWKRLQLRTFGLISSTNAFLASQYFTVRGIRTLNGKIIQHELSKYYQDHCNQENAPIPSQVSYYHFMDESYHFNSSTILSHDVLRSLPKPTAFERMVGNLGIAGCQKDHFNFSVAVRGIFWPDTALFPVIHRILTSPAFSMSSEEAREMVGRCFTEESDALHAASATHHTATESYKKYVEPLDYVNAKNKDMRIMAGNSIERYLTVNRRAFRRFKPARPQGLLNARVATS